MEIKHNKTKAERLAYQNRINGDRYIGYKQKPLDEWQAARPNYKREMFDAIPDIAYTNRFVVSNDSKRVLAAKVEQIGHISVLTPKIRNVAKLVSDNATYVNQTSLELAMLSRTTAPNILQTADEYAKSIIEAMGYEAAYNGTAYVVREKMQ